MIQTEIKLPIIATKLDDKESYEYWRYYTAIKVSQYQYHHIPIYAKTWCSSNSAISPRVRSFEFFPPKRKRVVCELSALGFSHSRSPRHCMYSPSIRLYRLFEQTFRVSVCFTCVHFPFPRHIHVSHAPI